MTHDLHDFMAQISDRMNAEYERIRKTATKDPGTAGDEGEENWAQLLRDWLPKTYQIVTKGQILNETGELSPQIDILVLKPSYPPYLHHKKKYLLSGIAAAFECKLTLKKNHVFDAMRTCAKVKRMTHKSEGDPYSELMTSPIFGLLAHAHSWRPSDSKVIDQNIVQADLEFVNHPREMLDLICISNLATWVTLKEPLSDPKDGTMDEAIAKLHPMGIPTTSYMCHSGEKSFYDRPQSNFSPLGTFINELMVKLAWEDNSLRDIASYFLGVNFSEASSGQVRYWDRSIYSASLKRKISLKKMKMEISWDKWAFTIQ